MRVLTPEQEDEVRMLNHAGVCASDLAGQFGVSRRTIFRTLQRTTRSVQRVEVGGYHATYEIGEEGPIQLTPWRAA